MIIEISTFFSHGLLTVGVSDKDVSGEIHYRQYHAVPSKLAGVLADLVWGYAYLGQVKVLPFIQTGVVDAWGWHVRL